MSDSIIIKKVITHKDLKAFIRLPHFIYADNPYWVAPLNMLVRQELDFKKNPFWKHAKGELFLAEKNGKIVGRISAQIDFNLNKFHKSSIGYFGYFECVNDPKVSDLLFFTAEKWLLEKNIKIMRGPCSPSINGDCGFMTEGFNRQPVFGTPYNFPYYNDLAENYGFKKVKELWSYEKLNSSPIPGIVHLAAERFERDPRISIRNFDIKDLNKDTEIVKDLFNECWSENWGFTPVNFEEMKENIGVLRYFHKESAILLVFLNSEPIGLCINVPDLNELISGLKGKFGLKALYRYFFKRKKIKGCRCILLGFKKKYRGTGIAALLYSRAESILQKKYAQLEVSWELEDNKAINNFIQKIGAVLHKRYSILEKEIIK